jgi:hypothetical protein
VSLAAACTALFGHLPYRSLHNPVTLGGGGSGIQLISQQQNRTHLSDLQIVWWKITVVVAEHADTDTVTIGFLWAGGTSS